MRFLIDTHIFLWALSNPSRIEAKRLVELEIISNTVYVSSITIAEIMIKASIGKLKIDFNPVDLVKQSGFELLDFTGYDALLLQNMPFHHKDPFDRMLIAQAITNKYPIMSNDKKFHCYDCQLL